VGAPLWSPAQWLACLVTKGIKQLHMGQNSEGCPCFATIHEIMALACTGFSWAVEPWSCWQQGIQCLHKYLIVPYLLGVYSRCSNPQEQCSPRVHSQVSADPCSYKLLNLETLQFSMHAHCHSTVCVMHSCYVSPEFAMPYASHPCRSAVGALTGAQ